MTIRIKLNHWHLVISNYYTLTHDKRKGIVVHISFKKVSVYLQRSLGKEAE